MRNFMWMSRQMYEMVLEVFYRKAGKDHEK